jgi:phosphoglycerate dehydrogenase-like enzyme
MDKNISVPSDQVGREPAHQEVEWIVGITDHITPPADIEQSAFPQAGFRFLPDWRVAEENRKAWQQVDAILAWHWMVDQATLDVLDRCKIVVRYGVGYDLVDVEAVAERGIPFCNTPDYGTEEVADTACGMILTLQRKILAYDRDCRRYTEDWQKHLLHPTWRTSECTLGLIGVGRIGTAVVNRMKPFGYRIVGYDPYQPSGHEKAVGYHRVDSLAELLSKADIVSIHCPLTEETRGMIDAKSLRQMKPGALIVNTARGGIFADLDCLEEALHSGHLAAAALDVLPDEPPKDHPLLRAWREDADWIRGRLIITPHSAYYSERGSYEMRYKAAETARLYLAEGKLRNQIVPESRSWIAPGLGQLERG